MEAACLATPRIPAGKMWGAICASEHGIPGRWDTHLLVLPLWEAGVTSSASETSSFSERLVRHACHRNGYDRENYSLGLGVTPMGAVKAWHVAARATRARTGRKAIDLDKFDSGHGRARARIHPKPNFFVLQLVHSWVGTVCIVHAHHLLGCTPFGAAARRGNLLARRKKIDFAWTRPQFRKRKKKSPHSAGLEPARGDPN